MAGRDVPFRGRRQPGIDIDAAFGHPAELDRRAEFAPDRARPCRNESFGPGIAMRAADRDRPRLAARRASAGTNRLDQRLAMAERQPFRAAADNAAPDQPERGRADDAEQRRPVGYERQIDGEFVAAGDEFLGAVERIDQEETFLIGRRGLRGALFRQRRYAGRHPGKAVGDDSVGRQIGLRYRRSVGLAVDLHGGTVDGEDGRTRPDQDVSQRFDQRCCGIAVEWTCLIHGLSLFAVRAALPLPPRAGSRGLRSVSNRQTRVIRNCPPAICDQEPMMSGTSSPGPAPDALELAALLCSRVCHDLISPVGAIVNGLEVLDDNPKPEDREFALDLICKSARTASARLQFCRLAFGAAGSAGAQIDLGDAQNMARGHLEDGKTRITWNLPRVLLPKNKVKLLLNMMVIAQQTIPRGGMLTVDAVGEGEGSGFRVSASGLNARLPQNIAELLSSGSRSAIDAHAVQPYYTRLLAQACGLKVVLAPEGEAVVVTAS